MKTEQLNDSHFNIDKIMSFQSQNLSIENNLCLQDISVLQKTWDKHKNNSAKIAEHYMSDKKFKHYAYRINLCSQMLDFQLVNEHEENRLKLNSARFCRVRYCPVCQWRRSLKWKAKAFKIITKIVEDYSTYRWLFLTLTAKNCKIYKLRETLQWLNKSWQRLSQKKRFPGVCWLRSTEVTKGKNSSAHPHFHCLLIVKPSYYGKYYIKQDDWVKLWQNSLRVDYDPIVDIRSIKREREPTEIIPEILKYCVKESDLVSDRQWILELTHQMHNLRTVATGGILKTYFKQLEQDEKWKIEENNREIDFLHLYFQWRYKDNKYIFSHS